MRGAAPDLPNASYHRVSGHRDIYRNSKMDYFLTGKIAYPKLTLYAFQLKHSLAQNSKTPIENANVLWLKCQQLGQKFGVNRLKKLHILIEKAHNQKNSIIGQILADEILAEDGILRFTAFKKYQKNNLRLIGEVNPLQIHDTYALDLTLRYPHPEVQLTDLRGLNPDDCLLPKNIKASLGQTLVFFAKPIGKIVDEQAFADACLAALLSSETVRELKIYCQHQGQLLGSPIFEYNNNADSLESHCHLLIWLNTHDLTTKLENQGEYYYPLINLLLCRSKIIYARYESMWCYQKAREAYSKLEQCKQEFKDENKGQKNNSKYLNFDKFNNLLNKIPEISFNYVDYLRDLELHRITIQTNSKNYRLYLDKLKKICLKSDNLEFLSNFLELAEDTFVEQINTDLAYLTPGQNLFDQMIETIRGIVEVEQAKRDRTTQDLLRQKEEADKLRDRDLQTTIAIVGVGLGAAGIGSSTAPYFIPQQPTQPVLPPFVSSHLHPLTQSLFFSLFCGFVGAITAGGLSYLIQNRSAILGRIFKLNQSSSKNITGSSATNQTLLEADKQNK